MLAAYLDDQKLEAGTDEAGRGCLAGPVVAAAVILSRDFSHNVLRDSKKLNARQREELSVIIRKEALSYGVAMVGPDRIDEINILNASIEAMHKALEKLEPQPESILVDGNRFKAYGEVPFHCIIKGDDKFFSIAAASVLAKYERDRYMQDLSNQYPEYCWYRNMGYPTLQHRHAIAEYGYTRHHRKSFSLLKEQSQLELFRRD